MGEKLSTWVIKYTHLDGTLSIGAYCYASRKVAEEHVKRDEAYYKRPRHLKAEVIQIREV